MKHRAELISLDEYRKFACCEEEVERYGQNIESFGPIVLVDPNSRDTRTFTCPFCETEKTMTGIYSSSAEGFICVSVLNIDEGEYVDETSLGKNEKA
jgi:hypothetical protein